MRLIDADAIHYCNYDLDNYHSFRAVEDDEIAEMPTIDAVPVVHGYWRDCFPDVHTCSCCKHNVPRNEYGHKYAYCPHCGARMDGE